MIMHRFGLLGVSSQYDYKTCKIEKFGKAEDFGYKESEYGGNLKYVAKTAEPSVYLFLDKGFNTLDVGVDDINDCDLNIVRLAIKCQGKKQSKTTGKEELIRIYLKKV